MSDDVKRFKYGRIDLSSIKKEICSYAGECQVHRTTEKDSLSICEFCKFAAKFDMPKIINDLLIKKGCEI